MDDEQQYTDVDECWEDLWKHSVCNDDGSIDIDAVKQELYDYLMLLDFVPRVYCHITGDRISKPHTLPSVVCDVADTHYEELYGNKAEMFECCVEALEVLQRHRCGMDPFLVDRLQALLVRIVSNDE